MKPLILKITGINSFYNEQIIDFSKILGKGIFGIFGVTGSGKSSIIDAITLALYGKINRYDGKNGNREFININKDSAKVYFKFSIKNGKEDKVYTVVRQFKKDSKGSAKSSISRLSINKGNEEEILADKTLDVCNKLEKIIGLNYDDFIRAVVLPQGKFSEFLMLENKDKRNMLERIFGLEKYGTKLSEKINFKRKQQEEIVKDIEREISYLGEINFKNLQENKNILEEEETYLEQSKKETEAKQKYLNKLEENLNLKKELEELNKQVKALKTYEVQVKEWEIQLKNSKKVDLIKPYLDEVNKLENIILKLEKEIETKENENKTLIIQYEDILKQYENAKKKKEEQLYLFELLFLLV